MSKQLSQKKGEAKPGAEFVELFGDVGARWYLEGRKFSDCTAEHIRGQDAKIAELESERDQLRQQLADLPGACDLAKGLTAAFANAIKQQRPN